MRTTLTLDPDVAALVEETVHRERRPMKQIINDALRRGLGEAREPARPYHVHVHHAEVRPGLDLGGFNRLADELEDEVIVAAARASR